VAVLQPTEPSRTWTVDEVMVTEPSVIRRAIGAAAVGNITEWYDFGVYAYFEPTIKEVFFSDLGDTAGTIATFGLFAVAFLVRPFGGMFFGPLADRIGRNKVLATTMLLMAAGTFAIGCIPSHDKIGVLAPILLLVARLVQGFSTGGEYGNAMTFIAEYAPDRRRGFLGSWLEFGTFTGYILGAIIVTVATAQLSEEQLLAWGWRLPFFVALPLGIVGVYLRTRLADTPAFDALEREAQEREQENRGGGELRKLTRLWPFLLVCMGLVLAWNVTNYMLTSYMPTYVTDTMPKLQGGSSVSETTSQYLQIAVMAVALVMIPLLGRLSDRVGRKPIAWVGSVGLVVLAFPMILLIRHQTGPSIFLGLLIMGLLLICFSATMPSTLPALFPTEVRGAGLSVSFNVSVSAFAGTTSVVVGALVGATGDLNWPAYYLIVAGLIGCVSVWAIQDPNGRRMWGSAPAAQSAEEAEELVARPGSANFTDSRPDKPAKRS
jgi:MHS family proline/betaine transporter-like MFS transporter